MGTVVVLLSYPLATTIVGQGRSDMFIERRNDTARLANLAASDDRAALRHLMERYAAERDMDSVLLGRDGAVLATSRNPPPTFTEDEWQHVSRALNGYRNIEPVVDSPWGDAPMIVAEPVIVRGAAIGAVVTLSSTKDLRADLVLKLALLLLCQLAALVACVYAAFRLTKWMLRPVRTLDRMTRAIADGRLDLRLSEDHGPPELQHLIRSFNRMADSVRSALEQQRAFVADASHQLRNPLNALLLRLDLAGTGLLPEGARELEEAKEEGRRLAALLDSMLALATADGGIQVPESVDLVWLVNDRLQAWSAVARQKNLQMVERLSGSSVVTADGHALASALDAVLDNAVKFTPSGGSIDVELLTSDHGAETGVSIADTGEGLPGYELSRAGDRFWRSPRHQNVAGSGLGLSIVRRLLRESGGRLEVASRVPHGLSVTLWVPHEPQPSMAV
jgi:signal transduction histidine kinase